VTIATRHAAVWIDHAEAKIFHVDGERFYAALLHPRHFGGGHSTVAAEHARSADTERFFHDVTLALEGAEELLVAGPGTAKLALVQHVHRHDRVLEGKIVGVKTVDHSSDSQFVAFVRSYFLGRTAPTEPAWEALTPA
jgi:hypothetical protein